MDDLNKTTDFELVALCCGATGRDDRPFKEFMARHSPLVIKLCRRRFSVESDVDDLVQMVFLRAHRYLNTFDGRSEVSSWLFRIAENVCNNEHRRRKRRPHEYQARVDWDPASLDELGTVDVSTEKDEIRLLMKALDLMKHDDRRVLELLHLQEKSVREVAIALGLGESATKMRALRARKTLRSTYMALARKGSGE